jgi:putative phage-type endonuclease
MSQERYTVETYSNRRDWLRARKSGIGASEAAGILGYGGRSAYSIAQDKLTQSVDDSTSSEEAYWGLADEPAIAKRFCEETGLTVTDPGNFTIFRSVEKPWLFATPDRLMLPMAALEIKETFGENGAAWQTDVPRRFKVQLQQTMWILGVPKGYFAARINTGFGVVFKYHPMNRNDKFLGWALPKLDAFWASIQRGEMPDIDGSMETARALHLRYDQPIDNKRPLDLPEDLEPLGAEYDALTAIEADTKKKKQLIKNRVKAALGNESVGVLPDASGFKWVQERWVRKFYRVKKVRVE